MNELHILNPVKPVTIRGETIEVREMRWKEALGFAERLSTYMVHFTDADGRIILTGEKIAAILIRSGDMASELVCRSTGKERAWVDELRPTEVLDLLAAAIEVNLHEDLLGKAGAVGRRLQAVIAPTAAVGVA